MKLLCILICFSTFLFANDTKEILLLHSYSKGLKWTDGISEGVENVLKSFPEYELSTEYMDSKKVDTKVYFDTLIKLYEKKFQTRKYEIIIAADNYAYEFAIAHHDRLFKDTPVVFCGVENFDKKNIPIRLQRYFTGVVEYKVIRKNVQLIKDLFPHIKNLYIVSDDSFSSLAIKKQILDETKEFKTQFNIVYDNQINIDTLTQKINSLPADSVVLFTSLYKDMFGRYIPYYKLRNFFNNSKYPVFALNKIHLGEGIVGGVMINPEEQGFHAAHQAIEIIKGKNPLQIDIIKPTAKFYFDYKVLEKFGILPGKVDSMANVINKPISFFETNRSLIDSAFILMPVLFLLIIVLVLNIAKKISLEIKLIEQNKLDNVLLNNIKSAIFWKSKDDILLGCNDALCKFLSLKKEEIIGKHIKDVMPEICQKVHEFEDDFIDELEVKLYHTKATVIDVFIRRMQYLNKNNEKAGVVTIISDVTDMKQIELQRKKDEQFIIQRSKLSEIGEMMTSIAHQWKTPLVEISSIAQELLYKRKKEDISEADTSLFVDDIMNQVRYMTNTIDEFRAFIKPSTKKSFFCIASSIKEILNVIEHNLKYNYIEVKIDNEINDEFVIYGYPNEFKQSILNVINNAKDSIVKRKEKEDIEAQVYIHIYNEQEDRICIDIHDNGLGIKEKELDLIFEPFYTSKKDGDGFGLYMAKLIIEEKMQGKISAYNTPNGAMMRICVKKKVEDEDISA
jgi:PAS domain S-box-containing protein